MIKLNPEPQRDPSLPLFPRLTQSEDVSVGPGLDQEKTKGFDGKDHGLYGVKGSIIKTQRNTHLRGYFTNRRVFSSFSS